MSSQQNDYSQFGHNLQNSESNWAGILPPSLSPISPFHQTPLRAGFGSNDNFILDEFLLPATNMELTHLTPSIQDFKGILSNPSTTFENKNQYTYHGDQSSDLSLKKFVNVSIPSYTTDIDTEGKYTSFTILVQTAFASISIKRRYKNFLALHQDLSTKVPKEILPQLPKKKRLGILDPLFVEERRASLEKYLQDITTLRSCWSCPHLIQFLDDHPPVLFLQIQTAKLNDEVHFLRYQNESLISQYQENAAALNSANIMISDLHKRMIEWEDMLKRGNFYQRDHNHNQYHHHHQTIDQNHIINSNHNNRGVGVGVGGGGVAGVVSYKNTIQNQYPNVVSIPIISEPIHHVNRASLSSAATVISSSTSSTGMIIPTSSGVVPSLQPTSPLVSMIDSNNTSQQKNLKNVSLHSSERQQQQQQQQQQHIPEEIFGWQQITNDSRNNYNTHISHHSLDSIKYSDHIESTNLTSSLPYTNQDIIATKESSIIPNGRRKSYTYSVSSTNVLELLSVCGVPSYLDRFTNNILSYILPSFEQLQYRFQVEKYVAKLVRKSLGAQIHQMGIHSLRCFLPDDPISLSIYLCRGLEHSWYLRLNEKLCRMSSGVANSPHPGNQIQSPQPISSVLGGMTGIAKGLSELQDYSTTTTSTTSTNTNTTTNSSSTPTLGHIISNVSFMNEHGIHSLQCLVANMTVDIRVNIKLDLCFYAFLEEFDRLIGRDHLFKKSLTLIRNWWTLEVPNETETLLSTQYIPNDSICIMVCAIFNRFYRRIYHPIQAFSIFVSEYASFDWQLYVLTVYGPILRSSLSEEGILQESFYDIYPDSIITSQLIGKYQELYNETSIISLENEIDNNPLISLDSISNYEIISPSIHSPEKDLLSNTTPTTIAPTFATVTANISNTTSLTTNNNNNNSNNNNTSIPISTTNSTAITTSITSPTTPTTTVKSFSSSLGALFERVEEDNENDLEENQVDIMDNSSEQKIMSSDCIKIFHPINKSINTVPDSMTNHLATVFIDIMKKGESKILSLLHLLILFEKTPGDLLIYEQLENISKNLFKETITRFGLGWKPDLPTPLINEIAAEAETLMEEFTNEIVRDQLTSSLENMFDLIKYTHFLASAEVTESALKTLSKDILQERGPLPVGEIGKMLQEITGISTLSAFLKDKFGGLKKFLEIFPDDFLISTDHPFNPHVFFRTSISSDELKLINQGIIPQHLTTKTNKRRPSRKKRLSSGSLQSSLPSELNMSTISYGSGSSARSGSSGVSRSTSPPPGQGYSPSQYFHSNSPLRPNFYPPQGRSNMYPLTRTQSSSDTDRIMIAPGLSLEYDQHQIDSNYEKNSRHNIRHVDPYIDEELPTFNPQPNLHPRRRRTVPGSSLNLDAGIISVAPGIDGPPIASGLNNNTINTHYPQLSISDHRGINYAPSVFRNR